MKQELIELLAAKGVGVDTLHEVSVFYDEQIHAGAQAQIVSQAQQYQSQQQEQAKQAPSMLSVIRENQLFKR